jgi:hypothetical protein
MMALIDVLGVATVVFHNGLGTGIRDVADDISAPSRVRIAVTSSAFASKLGRREGFA